MLFMLSVFSSLVLLEVYQLSYFFKETMFVFFDPLHCILFSVSSKSGICTISFSIMFSCFPVAREIDKKKQLRCGGVIIKRNKPFISWCKIGNP